MNDQSEVFIQWKGTDVSADFWCECGTQSHFRGWFAYGVRCPSCRRVFAMPCAQEPFSIPVVEWKGDVTEESVLDAEPVYLLGEEEAR